ncbi:unnamed protein product [Angiostrongylus costaricensis]|uniref:RRM domain-containing protein n=1 Tax=Angiostrongylus costaricensis TaxID=334426 RepID=A0A158PIP1_ANGCS|nr:unnamed protein product [Angiostrongylus costaricensis]
MDCKVYVGGLPNDATSQEIEDAFYRFGRIRKVWVARRPPGFAFVEFEDSRDAEDAVKALDGSNGYFTAITGEFAEFVLVSNSHTVGAVEEVVVVTVAAEAVTHTDRALLVVDALEVVIEGAVLVPGAQTIGAALLQMETAVRAADLVHRLHNSKQRVFEFKMDREDIDKVAVSTGIIFLSGLVLFQSCHRASTIYFFELQTTAVIFIEPLSAVLLPFALSVLLWLVYKGTKRSTSLELERKAIMDKRKEVENISLANSRKPSRSGSRKVSLTDEQQFFRLNRLLSDIQEQDTIHSIQDKPIYRDSPEEETKETAEESDELLDKFPYEEDLKRGDVSPRPTPPHSVVAYPENVILGVSRKSSAGSVGGRRYEGADPNEDDSERERNEIYMQIGQTNLFTYSLSALNLLPKNRPGLPELKLNFSDIISEFFAVHLPVWACVAAFYVVLLELFGVHFAYYFYYHEETMVYSAFSFSIMFGLFHEFWGGWVSNDILAFSSIYIACSRIQAVSYQAGLILLVGMAIYDIFWLHVVDLITLKDFVNVEKLPKVIPVPDVAIECWDWD